MLIDVKNLNQNQAKGLSNFFFDLAKALVLGVVAVNVVSSEIITKFLASSIEIILAINCIRIALNLLEE